MKIDQVVLENPFILAPLAGYTDLAFRLLCREYGAGLCFSEMVSCHGLVFRQKSTLDLIATRPAERPVVMQLFGSEPDIMAEAAAILSEQSIDGIDINMGCPVKKVIKKGAGAALIKNPRLAAEIIRKVRQNSQVPVTVKTRTGWNHHAIVAEDFAKMAEDSGASAITVHGRTWTDGFSGEVDWQCIARVKKAVTIPVIGNGDIISREDGLAMMAKTGCDGVMIGRGALGRPWIFSENINPNPSLHLRVKALLRHLDIIASLGSPVPPFAKTKNHAGKYFKGITGSASIRQKVYSCSSYEELHEFVNSLIT